MSGIGGFRFFYIYGAAMLWRYASYVITPLVLGIGIIILILLFVTRPQPLLLAIVAGVALVATAAATLFAVIAGIAIAIED